MTDIFRYATNWVLAVVWHLAMVLTGRPQVAYLSDKSPTLASFFLTYLAAGVLRTNVSGSENFGLAFCALLLNLLVVYWLIPTDWPRQMVSVYLAVSTAVDLAGSTLILLGLPSQVLHFAGVFELILMYRAHFLWKKALPPK